MPHETPPRRRAKLTREAKALLAQAAAGGMPAFVTQNLRRIAIANGVEVTDGMTPNAILDALRSAQSEPVGDAVQAVEEH